jgi:hypothetical protein
MNIKEFFPVISSRIGWILERIVVAIAPLR